LQVVFRKRAKNYRALLRRAQASDRYHLRMLWVFVSRVGMTPYRQNAHVHARVLLVRKLLGFAASVCVRERVVCVGVCWSVLQCVTVCCSVLQCVAVCYSVLQCVTVGCSGLQWVAVGCSGLQYAVCCSVLQCVAV